MKNGGINDVYDNDNVNDSVNKQCRFQKKKPILIVTIAVIVTLMSAVEIMITISNSIDNDDDTGIEHAFAIIMTGT